MEPPLLVHRHAQIASTFEESLMHAQCESGELGELKFTHSAHLVASE
jgi:hypothetical protein